MNIQSLSIVVPTGKCWNKCHFCVSRQHDEDYGDSLDFSQSIPQSYINRMEYVRAESCNSMIITGTAEPQQNLSFIYKLLKANKNMLNPFYNIAIQTTGTNFTENEVYNLAYNGVTTLALSVSSFSNVQNRELIQAPIKVQTMELEELYSAAKKYNMNVRLCLNLTDEFNNYSPKDLFEYACRNNIDQLTFRKIYAEGFSKEAKWVKQHEYPSEKFESIKKYVKNNGIPIAVLPYEFIQYSVHEISVVIDDNCMAKNEISAMKYAILRPNGHLYSRWDTKGSLIF